jgi:hypothetical protein
MKKIFIIILSSILVFFSLPATAKIWRVNNNSVAGADFADIQSAVNAANPGDTIQVEGAGGNGNLNYYNGFNCAKKLIFLGTGYLLNTNPETQVDPTKASQINAPVNFYPGSKGSVIMGMSFLDFNNSNGLSDAQGSVNVLDDNITIARNAFNFAGKIYLGDITGVRFVHLDSTNISQNYFINSNVSIHLLTNTTVTHLLVANNICSVIVFDGNTNANGYFINNIFVHLIISSGNIILYNNIISENLPGGNGVFSLNNIFSNGNNGSPDVNGNFSVADFSTIFSDWNDLFLSYANSTWPPTLKDANAELSPSSPAIAAGLHGVDCGPFGGGRPYILSGMPPIPSIYSYSAPPTTTSDANTMNVTIGIKSHN